jgi:1-aminocyclopropane-1-carboxylate deaminase
MFALFDLVAKDDISEGSRILAIHTGGLFGILGMKNNF